MPQSRSSEFRIMVGCETAEITTIANSAGINVLAYK
jgi:hypothetical protein